MVSHYSQYIMFNPPFHHSFTLHFRALFYLLLCIVFRLCYTFVFYCSFCSQCPFWTWLSSLVLVFLNCHHCRGLVFLCWHCRCYGSFPPSSRAQALLLALLGCSSSLVFMVVGGGAFPHSSSATILWYDGLLLLITLSAMVLF